MLWWFAQTTLIAAGLAVVATLAGRWKRLGPEARHALWLIVLLKFAMPPVVAWPWSVLDAWPARVEPASVAPAVAVVAVPPPAPPPPFELALANLPEPAASAEPLPEVALPESQIPTISDLKPRIPTISDPESRIPKISDLKPRISDLKSESPTPTISDLKSEISNLRSARSKPEIREPIVEPRHPKSETWSPGSALLVLWLAGSIAVVVRRGVRIIRFRRSLATAKPAPGWLVDETRAIGERVGVRPPPVLATSGVGTPLLWCLGRPRLILPDALIGRLDPDRWPGILAHELAHLASAITGWSAWSCWPRPSGGGTRCSGTPADGFTKRPSTPATPG